MVCIDCGSGDPRFNSRIEIFFLKLVVYWNFSSLTQNFHDTAGQKHKIFEDSKATSISTKRIDNTKLLFDEDHVLQFFVNNS